MPALIEKPTLIQSAGYKHKIIEEFVGRLNTGSTEVSIAHMISPSGWEEPSQTPEFDEYTIVLNGMLRVETNAESLEVNAGEAVITRADEWVRYSTPGYKGAEYIAVCYPAFSPETVHRDADPE